MPYKMTGLTRVKSQAWPGSRAIPKHVKRDHEGHLGHEREITRHILYILGG
jgi:hypothetical protein